MDVQICVPPKPGQDMRDMIVEMREQGKTRQEIHAAMTANCKPAEPIVEEWKKEKQEKKNESDEKKNVSVANEEIDDPHRLARIYLNRHCKTADSKLTLRHYRNEYHRWNGSRYEVVAPQEISADLTALAKKEFDADNMEELKLSKGESKPKAKRVTRSCIANITNALSSMTMLAGRTVQPSWLCDNPPFPADEVFASRNGLLHLPSVANGKTKIVPTTPEFFSAGCVDYKFNPDAKCDEWLKFLDSIWPDDNESIDALQEWFGYLLLPDVSHQKMLMLLGPPRCGKGTIGRAIKRMIGVGNLASPTLASLAGSFGLWPLLGKSVALVADARLSGRQDAIAVVERLLSISGEDLQDVHRKNLPTITGIKLPIRFVLMSNELPSMRDASGALTTRVVLLRMTRTFYGREDKRLGERLEREAAGILNWAIQGWKRLRNRGAFEQPESGRELLSDLDDLSSPVKQFIREWCKVGREFSVTVDDLFSDWKEWCRDHGRDHVGTRETFGKDLRAALPRIKRTRPRKEDGSRIPTYDGIALKTEAEKTMHDVCDVCETELELSETFDGYINRYCPKCKIDVGCRKESD